MLHLMDSNNYNLHANSDHQPADQESLSADPVYADALSDASSESERGMHRSQRLHLLKDCLSKGQSVVLAGRKLNLVACSEHAFLKICEKVLQRP